tara:strand:- start:978 stop:1268 length:291 start_codon:yes stop_codon:yes gene_type:complete
MNNFKIKIGRETDFEEVWRSRDSHLDGVPGFIEFHLVKGQTHTEYTEYASHSTWESQDAFYNWVHSEAFRLAHKDAGKHSDLYIGPPRLEEYSVVI